MYHILCIADDITSTLSHQTTVFMMSHALQAWQHIPCIRHHTHYVFVITTSPLIMISHPLLYDITSTFYVTSYALYITSHPILISSHYCTYDITPLYMKPHQVCRATYTIYMWLLSHYLCHHTHCIDNITPSLCMTSHSLLVWHRFHYKRHHILTLWHPTMDCRTSHPLYLTSSPLYLWYDIHCIDDITPTAFMISHPL